MALVGFARSREQRPRVLAAGAARGPTAPQWIALVFLVGGYGAFLLVDQTSALALGHAVFLLLFSCSAVWKFVAAAVATPAQAPTPLSAARLPPYTVIAALYHEGAVVGELVSALKRIDYPAGKLQIIVVLEQDDDETLGALAWLNLPGGVDVLVKKPGGPKTKPNALNLALSIATGEHVVVYDAEDRPHPGQLREAAARFAAQPDVCYLQAPLRIANAGAGFLARQFALEYAGQFEVVLPALTRLGAGFPLGGTSNHFRTTTLRRAGGWDAFNVTEDADLGFRLDALGCKGGVLCLPTFEDAPVGLDDWLPQRTRWIKGYMQTWGVHTRRIGPRAAKTALSMQLSIGLGILGAAFHGPFMILLTASALIDLSFARAPQFDAADTSLLILAWAAAGLVKRIGAKRAGLQMRWRDGLAAPLYWPLQSLAFLFAVRQLVTSPYHWDKTNHAAHSASMPG
jgi:cellulose synthase/poly-beta-1,6-N-acetylglucosamine synthase-like glycosyltransferase